MDLYEIIKKTIDKWDPYGLLEIHCPEDEYDFESKEIAENINFENNIYEITDIISKIFINSFNEPEFFSIINCMKIAEKIKIQMEDDIFYLFVDYYKRNSENDDHFKKFNLIFDVLKKEYESNVINRIEIYNRLIKNINEDDKEYTGCEQMIIRLKYWANL